MDSAAPPDFLGEDDFDEYGVLESQCAGCDVYARVETCVKLGLLLCVFLFGACSAKQLGIPRVPVKAPSPDGSYVAAVRNHLSFDPPNQSLWLRRDGGGWVRLARLGEDTHWCNAIAWSGDSTRVAFLIQDASAMVFESATRRLLGSVQLVEVDAYPTRRAVRRLELSPNGDSLSVTVCDRRRGTDCETGVVPLVFAPKAG